MFDKSTEKFKISVDLSNVKKETCENCEFFYDIIIYR